MMNGLDFWLDFLAKNSRSLNKELNQNPSPKISGFLDFSSPQIQSFQPLLWGNKNGLPSMKVKKVENFQNKID